MSEWDWKPVQAERDLYTMVFRLLDRGFSPWKYPDRNWAMRIDWNQLVAPRTTRVLGIPTRTRRWVNGQRVRLSDWIYPRDMEF